MNVTPDHERMRALQEFSVSNENALRGVLGMFAYYAKWINCFAAKVRPLAEAKTFLLDCSALDAFVLLKFELPESSLQSIDKPLSFVIECDASDVAIFASLNQGDRPLAFMSRTLQGSKKYYPTYEKEATDVIRAAKKSSHLLLRQTFNLITHQRFVAFMLDRRRRTKNQK